MMEEDPWKDLVLTQDIPIPTDTHSRTVYPWKRFKVGDSAFFNVDRGGEDTAKRLKNRLDQSTRTYSNKQVPPWRFVHRITLHNEESGVRTWRTK
jgi:hypothetical protein